MALQLPSLPPSDQNRLGESEREVDLVFTIHDGEDRINSEGGHRSTFDNRDMGNSRMISEEKVVLVNNTDEEIGVSGKMAAHQMGLRHRAVSVFLFDDKKRVLLQQRAPTKYHCPGRWANTCCGHPRPMESAIDAASRRLWEELGLRVNLQPLTKTSYRADVGNGLVENEIVHLFWGLYDGAENLNAEEVSCVRLVGLNELKTDIGRHSAQFTPWLQIYVTGLWDELIKIESLVGGGSCGSR